MARRDAFATEEATGVKHGTRRQVAGGFLRCQACKELAENVTRKKERRTPTPCTGCLSPSSREGSLASSGLALLDAMLRLVAWVVVFTHHTSHEVQIWEGGGKGEADSPAIALALEPGPAQEQARLQVRAIISEEREMVADGGKGGLASLAGMRSSFISYWAGS